jgi:phosphonate transport system permease protein
MSKLPAPDSEELHDRYPDVFQRPLAARLSLPAMMIGACGIFAFGLIHLGFSPARMFS